MFRSGAPVTCDRSFTESVQEVRDAGSDALATLGFKVRTDPLEAAVAGYTGWRWTAWLGYGELIEIDIAPDIDVVRVTVTSWQNRGARFDLLGWNKENVERVLDTMATSLARSHETSGSDTDD